MPQRALDLRPQELRIAPEVALDRVLVEDDPVLAIPVHDRAAVVVPVRAELGSVVGDHDRHRPEDVLELLRQAVDYFAPGGELNCAGGIDSATHIFGVDLSIAAGHSTDSLITLLGWFAGGFVIYWILWLWRRRQGVNVDLAFKEIPIE